VHLSGIPPEPTFARKINQPHPWNEAERNDAPSRRPGQSLSAKRRAPEAGADEAGRRAVNLSAWPVGILPVAPVKACRQSGERRRRELMKLAGGRATWTGPVADPSRRRRRSSSSRSGYQSFPVIPWSIFSLDLIIARSPIQFMPFLIWHFPVKFPVNILSNLYLSIAFYTPFASSPSLF
jgi:hypothetical protein